MVALTYPRSAQHYKVATSVSRFVHQHGCHLVYPHAFTLGAAYATSVNAVLLPYIEIVIRYYHNICITWHALAMMVKLIKQLYTSCRPHRPHQAQAPPPTTTQQRQAQRRGPMTPFGGPLSHRLPHVAVLHRLRLA
eukprot:1940657-Amphidinium_carterae.5